MRGVVHPEWKYRLRLADMGEPIMVARKSDSSAEPGGPQVGREGERGPGGLRGVAGRPCHMQDHTVFCGGSMLSAGELGVGCLMLMVAGNLYAFNSYSDLFKAKLGLANSAAQMIMALGNLGLCFATPAGWFIDSFGTRSASFFGAGMGAGGYLLLYGAIHAGPGSALASQYALSLYYIILGQGSIYTYMAGLVRYKSFPTENRGKVIGVLDCMFGMSAFVVSSLFNFFFKANERLDLFFLTMAALVIVVNVAAFVIRPPMEEGDRASRRGPGDDGPCIMEEGDASSIAEELGRPDTLGVARDSQDEDDDTNEIGDYVRMKEQHPDVGGLRIFLEADYWGIMVFSCIVFNAGLLFINNVAYITTSLHKSEDLASALSMVIPFCSAFGRIVFGMLSDVLIKYLSRGTFLIAASLAATITNLALWAFLGSSNAVLVLASITTGMYFGCVWCIVPLLVSERFGSRSFGANWGNVIFISAVTYFAFSFIQNRVYSSHTHDDAQDDPTLRSCYGADCWANTFLFSGLVSGVALVVTVVLALHTRRGTQWV